MNERLIQRARMLLECGLSQVEAAEVLMETEVAELAYLAVKAAATLVN